MREHIIVDHKSLERRAADQEQSAADFEDTANIAAYITVNSGGILPWEKQSGNKKNENKHRSINPYDKKEANKSKDENASKQKGNTTEQKEMESKCIEQIDSEQTP